MKTSKRGICDKCGANYVVMGNENKCNHVCPARRTGDYNKVSDEQRKSIDRMKEELVREKARTTSA